MLQSPVPLMLCLRFVITSLPPARRYCDSSCLLVFVCSLMCVLGAELKTAEDKDSVPSAA